MSLWIRLRHAFHVSTSQGVPLSLSTSRLETQISLRAINRRFRLLWSGFAVIRTKVLICFMVTYLRAPSRSRSVNTPISSGIKTRIGLSGLTSIYVSQFPCKCSRRTECQTAVSMIGLRWRVAAANSSSYSARKSLRQASWSLVIKSRFISSWKITLRICTRWCLEMSSSHSPKSRKQITIASQSVWSQVDSCATIGKTSPQSALRSYWSTGAVSASWLSTHTTMHRRSGNCGCKLSTSAVAQILRLTRSPTTWAYFSTSNLKITTTRKRTMIHKRRHNFFDL